MCDRTRLRPAHVVALPEHHHATVCTPAPTGRGAGAWSPAPGRSQRQLPEQARARNHRCLGLRTHLGIYNESTQRPCKRSMSRSCGAKQRGGNRSLQLKPHAGPHIPKHGTQLRHKQPNSTAKASPLAAPLAASPLNSAPTPNCGHGRCAIRAMFGLQTSPNCVPTVPNAQLIGTCKVLLGDSNAAGLKTQDLQRGWMDGAAPRVQNCKSRSLEFECS